jgi:hypothetical protein
MLFHWQITKNFGEKSNQNTRQPDPSDPSDIINICPQQFGSGYERWIELRILVY